MSEEGLIDTTNRTYPLEERKLPWMLDVLVYPQSQGGVSFLCVLVLIPAFLDLVLWWLSKVLPIIGLGLFIFVAGITAAIIMVFLVIYAFWYFGECIRDSATGEVRAPDSLSIDREQVAGPMLRMLVCVLLFLGAGPIYYWNVKEPDAIFWGLLSVGVFIFPMAVLSVVMFDSIVGLNPVRILTSILRTFYLYCGVALVFYVLIFVIVWMLLNLWGVLGAISMYFVYAVNLYLFMVAAHLLGRFYYRKEEYLNWPV